MKSAIFETTIIGSHSITIPCEIAEKFYLKKQSRVKVKATFKNKTLEFHAALKKYKKGYFSMMFGKSNQKKLGVFPNDYFELQLFEDVSKYGVEIPEELDAVLLSDLEANTIFEALTPGRKRGLIYTIKRYKSKQTKVDKALLLMENLKRGIQDPKLWLKKN